MPADTRLDSLLDAWQEALASGTDVPAAELCREYPELLPELERQLAVLRRVERLGADETRAPASLGDAVTVTGPGGASTGSTAETLLGPVADGPPSGFVIERELGRGGMGVVQLARQEGLNRPVALKMILRGGAAEPKHHIRFLAEAEAVASVRQGGAGHPLGEPGEPGRVSTQA